MRFIQRLVVNSLASLIIVASPAFAFEIGDDDDAQMTIKVPKIANITESCFDIYRFSNLSSEQQFAAVTSIYRITSDTTWANTEKVVIRPMEKDEYGFDENNTWRDGNDTEPCTDFSERWENFDVWDSGVVQVDAGARLTIAAGINVEFDSDFRLLISDGELQVNGTEEQPVKFKGMQWFGIELSSSVGHAELNHCVVEGAIGYKPTTDSKPRGALQIYSSNVELNYCEITNNEAFFGGGIFISGASPVIRNTIITGNKDAGRGGGVFISSGSPVFIDSQIYNNQDATIGGGVYLVNSTNTRFYRTLISNNNAQAGAGLYFSSSQGQLVDSIVVNNSASSAGGGVLIDQSSSPEITNSVVAYNHGREGGGIYLNRSSSSMSMSNSIVASNSSTLTGEQIYANASVTLGSMQNNIIAGGEAQFGGSTVTTTLLNNISDEPIFVNPSAETGTDGSGDSADWRLSARSVGINAGLDSAFPNITELQNDDSVLSDYALNARIYNGSNAQIDIGAYEVQNNPPQLLSATSQVVEMAEDDGSVQLSLCDESQDDDTHEAGVSSVLVPWITVLPETDFGALHEYDEGDVGQAITSENSAPADLSGRVFYVPDNRTTSYQAMIQCQVKDQIFVISDADEQEDENRSLFSAATQETVVNVAAENDPPKFDNADIPSSGQVGELFELELQISDADSEDRFLTLNVRALELPTFMSLTAPDEDTPKWVVSGTPDVAGDYELAFRVSDEGGLFSDYSVALTVLEIETTVTVDGGDDVSAAPDEDVALQVVSPIDDKYRYEWQLTDNADTVIETVVGQNVLVSLAMEGEYAATLTLYEDDEQVGQDSVAINIATGFTDVPVGEREAPSPEQEALLDELANDDEPESISDRVRPAAWVDQNLQERIDTLAELAILQLDSAQRTALINGFAETTNSLSSSSQVTVAQSNQLLGAMDNVVIESAANTTDEIDPLAIDAANDLPALLVSITRLLNYTTGISAVQIEKMIEVVNELAQQQVVSELALTVHSQFNETLVELLEKSLLDGVELQAEGEWVSVYVVTATGAINFGSLADSGVQVSLSDASLVALQAVNGAASVNLGMLQHRVNAQQSVVVTTSASDDLSVMYDGITVNELLTLSIPVTNAEAQQPSVILGPDASTVSVIAQSDQAVSFNANSFGTFALSALGSEPTESSSSNESESSGCFMDGLVD